MTAPMRELEALRRTALLERLQTLSPAAWEAACISDWSTDLLDREVRRLEAHRASRDPDDLFQGLEALFDAWAAVRRPGRSLEGFIRHAADIDGHPLAEVLVRIAYHTQGSIEVLASKVERL